LLHLPIEGGSIGATQGGVEEQDRTAAVFRQPFRSSLAAEIVSAIHVTAALL
jgi:hypothetical protein